jgi:hypothetical protein
MQASIPPLCIPARFNEVGSGEDELKRICKKWYEGFELLIVEVS